METQPPSPSILLADPHAIYRAGITAILRQRYPTALFGQASSVGEAREKMVSQPWHLLICDLNLADRNGFALIQEARHLTPPIPTLVISANPV
jgi:DNA-binding NarL/FixJ family response regulator